MTLVDNYVKFLESSVNTGFFIFNCGIMWGAGCLVFILKDIEPEFFAIMFLVPWFLWFGILMSHIFFKGGD